jgi:hypothetical protein
MQRTLAALIVSFVLAAPAVPATAGDYARALPMQFMLRYGSPGVHCAEKCRPWVSAVGMIKPDTPRDFAAFAQANDIRGATIAFDSEGGSVLGAIALGRVVRRLEMTTTVGKPAVAPGGDPRSATLSPRADCDSMCAFVLLAGVHRIVPPEARVRVHQIWLGDRREDAMAANYSAEDLVLVQRDIGRLAQYTAEMGGSIDLLEIALRIPPWEPMRRLTREELSRMRLDSSVKADADAPTVAASIVPAATNAGRPGGINDRGWTLVERAGGPVLARRHPLTMEGEEIGSFDVMLSCGDNSDVYVLSYVETRRKRGGERIPEAIREITIALGGKTSSLAIASSQATKTYDLDTFAKGPVSAALVRKFAEASSRSLTVATASADNTLTSIRIGNTGIAQYYPQLAASCTKGRRSAELADRKRAELTERK